MIPSTINYFRKRTQQKTAEPQAKILAQANINKKTNQKPEAPMRNIAAPVIHSEEKSKGVVSSEAVAGNVSIEVDIDYRNFEFTPLEPFESITFEKYCGPTPESNWVIPGKVLVGAYPASSDDVETYELLMSIMKLNITTFVCLQQEYRANVTEDMWRRGNSLRPYFEDVKVFARNKEYLRSNNLFSDIPDEEGFKFVHFPIRDCSISDDTGVLRLCKDLVNALSRGEIMYIHCWGGHGRTGTVVCIMLHLMYGLSAEEAMERCQFVHDLRQCPVVVGSPQTQTQRDQVTRVIAYLETSASSPTSRIMIMSSGDSATSGSTVGRVTCGNLMELLEEEDVDEGLQYSDDDDINLKSITSFTSDITSVTGMDVASAIDDKINSNTSVFMPPLPPDSTSTSGSVLQLSVVENLDTRIEILSPTSTIGPPTIGSIFYTYSESNDSSETSSTTISSPSLVSRSPLAVSPLVTSSVTMQHSPIRTPNNLPYNTTTNNNTNNSTTSSSTSINNDNSFLSTPISVAKVPLVLEHVVSVHNSQSSTTKHRVVGSNNSDLVTLLDQASIGTSSPGNGNSIYGTTSGIDTSSLGDCIPLMRKLTSDAFDYEGADYISEDDFNSIPNQTFVARRTTEDLYDVLEENKKTWNTLKVVHENVNEDGAADRMIIDGIYDSISEELTSTAPATI